MSGVFPLGIGRGVVPPKYLETDDNNVNGRARVTVSPSPPGPRQGQGFGLGRGILSLKLSEISRSPGKMSPTTPTSPFTSPPFVTSSMTDPLRQSPSPPAPCDTLMDDCTFCQRPASNVVCRSCGYTLKGRVRAPCRLHPGVIHLMDFQVCPNCRASNLQEFLPEDRQF